MALQRLLIATACCVIPIALWLFLRCRSGFSLYVYPPARGTPVTCSFGSDSPLSSLDADEVRLYGACFLHTLLNSSGLPLVSRPQDACVLVPSLDANCAFNTCDETKLTQLGAALAALPHWDGGRNHLVFNYNNDWEHARFSVGQAIVARASWVKNTYRRGFDIQLPLTRPKITPPDVWVLAWGEELLQADRRAGAGGSSSGSSILSPWQKLELPQPPAAGTDASSASAAGNASQGVGAQPRRWLQGMVEAPDAAAGAWGEDTEALGGRLWSWDSKLLPAAQQPQHGAQVLQPQLQLEPRRRLQAASAAVRQRNEARVSSPHARHLSWWFWPWDRKSTGGRSGGDTVRGGASFNDTHLTGPLRHDLLLYFNGCLLPRCCTAAWPDVGFQEGMRRAQFALSPRGCGSQSYRLLEGAGLGTVPVHVGDSTVLPFDGEAGLGRLWAACVVDVKLEEVKKGQLLPRLRRLEEEGGGEGWEVRVVALQAVCTLALRVEAQFAAGAGAAPPAFWNVGNVHTGAECKGRFRGNCWGWGDGRFHENYTRLTLTSYGASCKVLTAYHRVTNKKVAVKTIPKSRKQLEKQRAKVKLEIGTFRLVEDHPNAVRVLEVFEGAECYYICMECCEGGELFDHISKKQASFTERQAAHLLRGLMLFLAHMHGKGIAHLDIKPENIMFDSEGANGVLKVLDFGSSAFVQPNETVRNAFGTVRYASPEMANDVCGQKADIWSVGVVMYILLSGRAPFLKSNDVDTLNLIKSGPRVKFAGERWAGISQAAKDCIKALLEPNPRLRPSAVTVLNMPWLKQQSRIRRLLLGLMADQLVGSGANQLLGQFYTLDKDFSGTLEVSELVKAAKEAIPDLSEHEINRMFEALDVDRTGTVDIKEFFAGLIQTIDEEKQTLVAQKSFTMLDKRGAGFVTKEAFMEVLLERAQAGTLKTLAPKAEQTGRPGPQSMDGSVASSHAPVTHGRTSGADGGEARVLLDPGLVSELEQEFANLDANGDGVLSFEEFKAILGIQSTPEGLQLTHGIAGMDRAAIDLEQPLDMETRDLLQLLAPAKRTPSSAAYGTTRGASGGLGGGGGEPGSARTPSVRDIHSQTVAALLQRAASINASHGASMTAASVAALNKQPSVLAGLGGSGAVGYGASPSQSPRTSQHRLRLHHPTPPPPCRQRIGLA
eukprot:XP_001693416.1 predicted protein [Chlamydomonas reinhardtii]